MQLNARGDEATPCFRAVAAAVTALAAFLALGCAGVLDTPLQGELRERVGRIVADPSFRCWALDYDYQLGPSRDGYYVEGPDDQKAISRYAEQTKARTLGVRRQAWAAGNMSKADAIETVRIVMTSGEHYQGDRLRMHAQDSLEGEGPVVAILVNGEAVFVPIDRIASILPLPLGSPPMGCTADAQTPLGRLVKTRK